MIIKKNEKYQTFQINKIKNKNDTRILIFCFSFYFSSEEGIKLIFSEVFFFNQWLLFFLKTVNR